MIKYTEHEIIRLISEEGKEPDWGSIGCGDEFNNCETCAGKCEWPPTGEPTYSVCMGGCKPRIINAWIRHQKVKQ